MHRPNAPIALADLSAAGVQLRPVEAVTIVRELLLLVARGDVAGVPSAHVIRLSSAGVVSVEGPVAAGGRPVKRAAQLLDSLLPVSDGGNQFRVPGGLKLVVARALGTLDLPPFPSLDSFAEALGRFAATDPAAAITTIVTSWSELVGTLPREAVKVEVEPLPAAQVQPFVSSRTQDVRAHLAHDPLTVSDIRRARRATGLPLASICQRSHIPIGMLRQLEWGYFVNWPTGNYGRSQLIRYARAAGLDEQLVVATLLPMIEQAERPAIVSAPPAAVSVARIDEPDAETVNTATPVPRTVIDMRTDLEPAGAQVLQRTVVASHSGRRRRAAALAALAIPALLVIGLLPFWWAQSSNIPISELPALVSRHSSGRPESMSGSTAVTPRRSEPVGTASTPQPATPAPAGSKRPAPAAPPARSAPTPTDAAEYKLASDRAFSPSFGSVGTAMFYQAKSSDGSALMRADADGEGDVLRITKIVDDTSNNWHIRPSPDGRQIAFDSDRDGTRGVYVADADGKHVRRVSGEGYAAVPSWSPDGGTLAFIRGTGPLPLDVWNLWTLDLSTGETRQITRNNIGQPWGGSWFPDGQHIAYSHETRLVIHDLENGTERAFDSPIKGRLVRTPAVSPDGRRVVFQVLRNGTWMLELRDGSMRRILDDPTAEEYTWSPDGRRMAYHSRRSGAWGVWVMSPR
jgi:dipeptidyl aminopeptidase/acylaminoacyl peptidase